MGVYVFPFVCKFFLPGGGVTLQAMTAAGWAKLEPLLCALMEGEFVAIQDRAEEMVRVSDIQLTCLSK